MPFHYSTLHYIKSHYIISHHTHHITSLRITSHYTTLHDITLHYNTLHYITLHYITLHYITLHYITLHYITLHYITLHYITLHYITLHYITLHYITLLYITSHHITLHYIILHYSTVHYITLHYITFHYIVVTCDEARCSARIQRWHVVLCVHCVHCVRGWCRELLRIKRLDFHCVCGNRQVVSEGSIFHSLPRRSDDFGKMILSFVHTVIVEVIKNQIADSVLVIVTTSDYRGDHSVPYLRGYFLSRISKYRLLQSSCRRRIPERIVYRPSKFQIEELTRKLLWDHWETHIWSNCPLNYQTSYFLVRLNYATLGECWTNIVLGLSQVFVLISGYCRATFSWTNFNLWDFQIFPKRLDETTFLGRWSDSCPSFIRSSCLLTVSFFDFFRNFLNFKIWGISACSGVLRTPKNCYCQSIILSHRTLHSHLQIKITWGSRLNAYRSV